MSKELHRRKVKNKVKLQDGEFIKSDRVWRKNKQGQEELLIGCATECISIFVWYKPWTWGREILGKSYPIWRNMVTGCVWVNEKEIA